MACSEQTYAAAQALCEHHAKTLMCIEMPDGSGTRFVDLSIALMATILSDEDIKQIANSVASTQKKTEE